MTDNSEPKPLPPLSKIVLITLGLSLALAALQFVLPGVFPTQPHSDPILLDRPVMLASTAFLFTLCFITMAFLLVLRRTGAVGRYWQLAVAMVYAGVASQLRHLPLAHLWGRLADSFLESMLLGGLSALGVFVLLEAFRSRKSP